MSLLRGAYMFVCRIPNALYSTGKTGMNIPNQHHHQQQQQQQQNNNMNNQNKKNHQNNVINQHRSCSANRSSTTTNSSVAMTNAHHHNNVLTNNVLNNNKNSTNINTKQNITTTINNPCSSGTFTCPIISSSHTVHPQRSNISKSIHNHQSDHHHNQQHTCSSSHGVSESGIGKDFLYSRPCYDCEIFLEKCMKKWGLRNVYYTTDMTIPYEYGIDKNKYATEMYKKVQEKRSIAAKERRALQAQQIEEQRLNPRGRDIRRELRLARLIPDTNTNTIENNDSNINNTDISSKSKSLPPMKLNNNKKNMIVNDAVKKWETNAISTTQEFVTKEPLQVMNYELVHNGSLLDIFYHPRIPCSNPKIKYSKKCIETNNTNRNNASTVTTFHSIPMKITKKHQYISPYPVTIQQQRRRIQRKQYIHSLNSNTSTINTSCGTSFHHDNHSTITRSSRSGNDSSSSLPSSPSNRTSRSVSPSSSRSHSRSNSPSNYKLSILSSFPDGLPDSPTNSETMSDCSGRSSPISNMSEHSLDSDTNSTPSNVSLESTLTLSLSVPSVSTSHLSSSNTVSTNSHNSSPVSLSNSGKHSLLSLYRTKRGDGKYINSLPYEKKLPSKKKCARKIQQKKQSHVPQLINHSSTVMMKKKALSYNQHNDHIISFMSDIKNTLTLIDIVFLKYNKYNMNISNQDTYCIPDGSNQLTNNIIYY